MDGKIWFKRGLPLFSLRDDIASWQMKSSVRRCQLTLQPSVPSCPSWDALQTNKRVEKVKSQGGQRDLAWDTNLDWTRIQGKDWTNIKPELSNTGSAGLHSLPFMVLKKKKKKGDGHAHSLLPPRLWNEAVKQLEMPCVEEHGRQQQLTPDVDPSWTNEVSRREILFVTTYIYRLYPWRSPYGHAPRQ